VLFVQMLDAAIALPKLTRAGIRCRPGLQAEPGLKGKGSQTFTAMQCGIDEPARYAERRIRPVNMTRVTAETERMMLDHISLGVIDLERSRGFYDAALRPLGLVRTVDFQGRGSDYGAMAGQFGVEFTITVESGVSPLPGMHLCFRAPNRASVREFHQAALIAGGRDDGPAGIRPQYHPDYYAAFVVDPDGHRIEAVCHAPEKVMLI
jgi:catechol 2,3-dioxygenase-like lactoylglutathione lyase family enzyme